MANLSAIGFCGVDNSVHPRLLALVAHAFPLVEYGVLFRPDKRGQPRYPTHEWIQQLAQLARLATVQQQQQQQQQHHHPSLYSGSGSDSDSHHSHRPQAASSVSSSRRYCSSTPSSPMKLAAHLCGNYVLDILQGDVHFVHDIVHHWGFQRIQINATKVNGVDLAAFTPYTITANPGSGTSTRTSLTFHPYTHQKRAFSSLLHQFPQVQFILQYNDETKNFWQSMLDLHDPSAHPSAPPSVSESASASKVPPNVAILYDESKGTGLFNLESWPSPSSVSTYSMGYAGGIAPQNITQVIQRIHNIAANQTVWIDMESSLRSVKNGLDVFDIDKCYAVLDELGRHGVIPFPSFLAID